MSPAETHAFFDKLSAEHISLLRAHGLGLSAELMLANCRAVLASIAPNPVTTDSASANE